MMRCAHVRYSKLFYCFIIILCILAAISLFTALIYNNKLTNILSIADIKEEATQNQHVLTLFTTFSNNKDRKIIESNTIKNWAWLNSSIQCLSMCTDTSPSFINNLTDYYKWTKRRISYSIRELPVVPNMFVDVMNSSDTLYYGYANSDILFSKDLIPSLESVHQFHHQHHENEGFLIVGGKRNVQSSLIGLEDVRDYDQLMKLKTNGTVVPGYAIDYFITSKKGYPWDSIEQVVVGRRGWDNYVVAYAYANNIIVYDITKTVTAIHQSYKGKGSEGFYNEFRELNMNILLAKDKNMESFIVNQGRIERSQYYTQGDAQYSIEVVKRTKIIL